MGGSGRSKQRRANAEQTKINRTNNMKMWEDNATNEVKSRGLMYDNDLRMQRERAGYTASQGVTKRRADNIRQSGKLLTDFQRQEKVRLLQARKGRGQVDASNEMISGKDRQSALDLINKPPEYWEALRNKAYDEASLGATSTYGKDKEAYVRGGAANRKWDKERGK